jgi:predicted unusual protein kinase regulating ubiquinone biosynthesis (AarF/ABC1/UbiB family)
MIHKLRNAAGKGFVNELDYQEEALNGEYFSEAIKSTPLADVVFAPKVLRDYTTGKVLTTEWVVGERLEKSNAADVSALCSIAMNSYLTVCTYTYEYIHKYIHIYTHCSYVNISVHAHVHA